MLLRHKMNLFWGCLHILQQGRQSNRQPVLWRLVWIFQKTTNFQHQPGELSFRLLPATASFTLEKNTDASVYFTILHWELIELLPSERHYFTLAWGKSTLRILWSYLLIGCCSCSPLSQSAWNRRACAGAIVLIVSVLWIIQRRQLTERGLECVAAVCPGRGKN